MSILYAVTVLLERANGLEANRHMVRKRNTSDDFGTGETVFSILEGMVYTTVALFAATVLYVGIRWYQGYPAPFFLFHPKSASNEMKMGRTSRMLITPDIKI